jgi:hypothetical protein
MTISEAVERAKLIWGDHRFVSVRLRDDGCAEVHLLRTGRQTDVRGRNYSGHVLDRNGHPVCHADCNTLEP